ncbi:MAG: ABC transporter substrate-binding protein [Clostridia bacterium]|nr:ABC transporter substrate-binding protein [Clostridia bacterium]
MLKKLPALLLLVCLVLNLSACSGKEAVTESTQAKTERTEATATDTYTFTDAHGREITMDKNPAKVVVLSGSFAEMWELAGGSLTGVTADAPEDRNLNMEGVTIVGESTHKPNLETIVSLEPDFVILAADTEQHKALSESLDDMGINNAFFKVEFFDDYIAAMEIMTELTGDEEAFTKNAENVREQALEVIEKAKDKEGPTVLYMRAMTTNVKAKGDDHHTGVILKDLGCDNIVDRYDTLLDGISLEKVIEADPDFIFYTTMGDDSKALAYLRDNLESNEAWKGLSAVKNGNFVQLPKEMFHYKPNAEWGNAYQYIYDIIYGEK